MATGRNVKDWLARLVCDTYELTQQELSRMLDYSCNGLSTALSRQHPAGLDHLLGVILAHDEVAADLHAGCYPDAPTVSSMLAAVMARHGLQHEHLDELLGSRPGTARRLMRGNTRATNAQRVMARVLYFRREVAEHLLESGFITTALSA